MYYDLNVPWSPATKDAELQRKVAFLADLGYNVLALSYSVSPEPTTGKLPSDMSCPIPQKMPFELPPKTQILRRLTLLVNDHAQNHRLKDLVSPTSGYDIVAVRPVDEKTLQTACLSLDCDLISLDLSTRYHFAFHYKMFSAAISRGVHIELCYGPGIIGNAEQRRILIQNTTTLIRVTRGRGLIISSECKDILACRGPADVVNLAAIWGLGQERGVETVTTEARKVVVNSSLKRTSYRGVVDIVYGGEKPEAKKQKQAKQQKGKANTNANNKRKFAEMNVIPVDQAERPLSNRAKKKLAKQGNEAARAAEEESEHRTEN